MSEAKAGLEPLVVTTAHRGVFFGYGRAGDGDTIELKDGRMCVYWTAECRGVFGLAEHGPRNGCRIGPAVPRLILRGVTAVMSATKQAAEAWEKQIWS